jgi:hypothetical protein
MEPVPRDNVQDSPNEGNYKGNHCGSAQEARLPMPQLVELFTVPVDLPVETQKVARHSINFRADLT